MKTAIYGFLLLCLSSCRLSQPVPFTATDAEAAAEPTVTIATPPATGTAAIAITDTLLSTSAKQAPVFLHQVTIWQPKQAKISPLVRYSRLFGPAKNRRPIATNPSGIVADRPPVSPGKSLFLAGAGAIIVLTVALIIPSITTLDSAILAVFILALGVAFTLLGLLSYLLGLYEKGRIARTAGPKK